MSGKAAMRRRVKEAAQLETRQRRRGILERNARRAFRAALRYAQALSDIEHLRNENIAVYREALAAIQPLRHRGHGRSFANGVIGRDRVVHAYKRKDGRLQLVAWPRERSKYQPHQGKRECERRRVGGFGWQRHLQMRGAA